MDIQSFIQSGLLEAYVLGQCSAEERAQVERMATEHAEVHAELAAIEVSLEGYATAHAVQPPDWMKASIMERIDLEKLTPAPPNSAAVNTPAPIRNNFTSRLFQILAFVLAALCGFLFMQRQDMGRENHELKSSTDSLQRQLIAAEIEAKKPDPFSELVCHPSTQRLVVSDGKGLNSVVYYNEQLKKVAYDPYNLPALKDGKHYQFWAIVSDKPVSLGMKPLGLCESMQSIENVQAFAISQEDKPEGNLTPTEVLAIKPVG